MFSFNNYDGYVYRWQCHLTSVLDLFKRLLESDLEFVTPPRLYLLWA